MKKKPRPLLSQPPQEFPDEDWLFIHRIHSRTAVDKGHGGDFLTYELSRELDRGRLGVDAPCSSLDEFSNGLFPETPFLKLSSKVQKQLIKKMREPDGFFDTHIHFRGTRSILQVNYGHPLTDETARHLETIAETEAKNEAARWPELDPSLFLPLNTLGDRATECAKRDLIDGNVEIFETSQLRVTMLLDLECPDTAIVEEFGSLLKRIRKTNLPPSKERDLRGKVNGPELLLRNLATMRLKRMHGSYSRVEKFLAEKNQEPPFKSEGGWNKAVKAGERMVENFKKRFEVGEEAESLRDGNGDEGAG